MNKMQEIINKDYTPLEKILGIATALCVGIIIGFMLAPAKKGIMIGSKNGCNNGSHNKENGNSNQIASKDGAKK
ncbi:MAG: hypothetical protein K2M46_05700 [Lachnospiraceae bacterium]|nr:hypothetical protein [Lachnospiraceae bacterium]